MSTALASPIQKIKSSRGQHSIEYAVLLTLVMVGIIVTGRYVIRSWNANLKGWEDSVVDSIQDPLLPGTPGSVPGCDPNDWIDQGCNLGAVNYCTGQTVACSEVEMLSTRTFDPSGCECAVRPEPPPTVQCTVNECCCTAPRTTGRCGANVTFVTGFREPACNTRMMPKNADGTCPDRTAEAWVLCGSDPDPSGRRYGCIHNLLCIFECTPPFVPSTREYGPMCPGDDVNLPSDLPNTFVKDGQCTDRKCETQCAVNYYPQGGPPATYCGPCGTLGLSKIGCPVTSGHPRLPDGLPTFSFGGCPQPQFLPCCYAP